MKHKFYYYEYSDDEGDTWYFGDYRKHLFSILDLIRDNPYQIRIKNEKDEELKPQTFTEKEQQLNAIMALLETL